MGRTAIGILFGGCSEEHDVSVRSAQEVARHLDPERYAPVYLGITRSGHWRLCTGPEPGWEDGCPAVLVPDRGVRGVLVLDAGRHDVIPLDVVLPVLHGRFGEDGAIQGLLELSGLPYVGCDVPSSALCMDKALAYTVVRAAGIATPRTWTLTADDAGDGGDGGDGAHVDPDVLPYPVFVKPARSGSSFGVTKVHRPDELADAVGVARRFDRKVIVEEAVAGSEVGCAVLGDAAELITGELDQIALSHGFFRIHQESEPETGSEHATITVPADITAAARDRVREAATAVYRALGCRGLARVDLFLTPDGRVVLNEVNTFPGLTSYSRYPRMMAAAGLSLGQVVDRLVAMAGRGATVHPDHPIGSEAEGVVEQR
ncbi:D-alanine--D-alanine ligase [Iamia sp. SCSIO 61187]|uniref:D-alanine--D-alanine ligase family protein n=1 Tax=Iamia sp. SCSIO 61187 TaxID=2722752 RepID=UPI001C62972C|nr:D-alanine--D-alanine ligase [Iamia sp. SCSIO 61187]